MRSRIVVIGGGFAGLWAAAAAARLRALKHGDVEIVLVAPDPFHVIRVRCYENDLSGIRVPLDEVLEPIGVLRHEADVDAIDPTRRSLTLVRSGATETLPYDRLVLAPGSVLVRPPCPGSENCFDVDTYAGAQRLAAHLATLGSAPQAGRWTAVIIGAGLVGLELACEMRGRLEAARASTPEGEPPVRVILLDRSQTIGAGMGPAAAPAIREALEAAQVELRPGLGVSAIEAASLTLSDGEAIPAATVIAATGMRANPIAKSLPVAHDAMGRVPVDACLAVEGVSGIYAAGDVASAKADEAGHVTVMSCQHARPMGRIAGHNAACDLLGCPNERIAFSAPDYVTVLDLGDWGAVYTSGWDRGRLVAQGAEAKAVKRIINRERIHPPRNGDREAIFAAAAPVIQSRPASRA